MKYLKISFIPVLVLVLVFSAFSKESNQGLAPILKHEKGIYVSKDHRIYLPGRETPIFLSLSTSDEKGAQSFLLYNEESLQKSGTTPETSKAQPFFMEGPGRHSVVHPNEKFWEGTNQPANKILTLDRIFHIWVDEDMPATQKTISDVPKIKQGEITIYGEPVSISLASSDATAGLKQTYISIDGAEFTPYSLSQKVIEETDHNLRYYAVDNVGNVEDLNVFLFALDLTAPSSQHAVKNIHKGDILAPGAVFELSSTDNRAGVLKTTYDIDRAGKVSYHGKAITLSNLSDGDHNLYYFSEDKVANVEAQKIYSFYLDKIPPKVEAKIVGDQHTRADVLYVSGRSKVKLTATDNKSGVKNINYLIDVQRTETYNEPFPLPQQSGQHSVHYFATDEVENVSPKKLYAMTLDLTYPNSNCSFIGPQAQVQDTLYISNKTQVKFAATDKQAGVQKIQYQLDGKSAADYSTPILVADHGAHKIVFYATDNVNNKEKENDAMFFVDTKPPIIHHHFSIETKRKAKMKGTNEEVDVYPVGTMVYLGATDKSSGVEKINYRINKGNKTVYKNLLPFSTIGEYTIDVEAIDQVGNSENESISFIIKNIPPEN